MKLITKTITFLTLLMMLSTTIYAEETKDVSYKVTIESDNISVVETELMGEVDNSQLQVQVIKQIGEQSTVIYTGNLGSYDNGAWNNVDFTDIQFLVLFDWNTIENEAVYIIPTASEKSVAPISLASSNDSINNYALENLDDELDVNINIIYNNEVYEGALIQNKTLNVFMTISNSGVARNLVCYLAEYDSDGKLLTLTANNTIPVPANESVTANLTKTFSNSDTASAKIFLWEEGNLKPITNYILLQSQPTDYYADVYTTAQSYDISKVINGRINTVSDIDYIKFVPDVSGTYIIQTTGNETMEALYNGSHTLISNGIVDNGNFYIKENLTANETYYIKVYGNSVGNYSLTIEECQLLQVNIYDTSLSINGDISSEVDSTDSVTVKLLSSSGSVLNTQTVDVSDSGELNAVVPVSVGNGQYKAIISANGKIVSLMDINVLKDSVSYSVSEGEFCSVPYVVTNAATLGNIYFSLVFDSDDFEIYDVCDYTLLVENGTGLISGGNVRILEKTDNSCVFKSTRTTSNWSGTVNSIKLKSKQAGTKETTRFVYQVK